MDLTPYIIAFFSSAVVFVIYLATSAAFKKKEDYSELRSRINPHNDISSEGLVEQETRFSMQQTLSPIAEACASILKLLGTNIEKKQDELKYDFIRAGISSANAVIYYLFYQRVCSWIVVFIAILIATKPASGPDQLVNFIIAIMLGALGGFGPKLYLKNERQKRALILTRSFPDALDLMLVCVESGLALDAALNRVCKELGKAHPVVTEELNRTRVELAMLNDRSQALINLAERTDLVPFRSLTAALIQTEKFGTSISETLRVLSEDYRESRLLYAEQKAGKIPAMITIPLITMLLPSLFLLILGPVIIRISQQGGLFGGG